MIDTNYDNYNIDISDIWDFEKTCFENSNKYILPEPEIFLRNIEDLIYKKMNPTLVFDWNRIDESQKNYYKRKEDEYNSAIKSLNIEDRFKEGFFIRDKKGYQYNFQFNIRFYHKNFDYWFALKLRQYQFKLFEVENFLNYQIRINFKNNFDKLNEFLEKLLIQYKNIFNNTDIEKIINIYITKKSSIINHIQIEPIVIPEKVIKKEKENQTKSKNEIKKGGLTYSFELKELITDPKYFKTNLNQHSSALSLLKHNIFIDKSTELNQLKDILSYKVIKPNNRIKWVGSIKELQWFIKELMYVTKKITNIKQDIWNVTLHCFVDENGNEFTVEQLRFAYGKRFDRKKILEDIVKKI